MKVHVNNQEYKLKFYHQTGNKYPRITRCFICQGDEVIGDGISFCSLSDTYCKETGRRLTLMRALNDAGFSREERTLFWQTYFQRKESKIIKENKNYELQV